MALEQRQTISAQHERRPISKTRAWLAMTLAVAMLTLGLSASPAAAGGSKFCTSINFKTWGLGTSYSTYTHYLNGWTYNQTGVYTQIIWPTVFVVSPGTNYWDVYGSTSSEGASCTTVV